MDCAHIEPLLAAYALGALDPWERGLVQRHLQHCGPCREQLAVEQRAVQQLPYLPNAVDPPPHVKTALLDRVEAYERHVPGLRRAATVLSALTRRIAWTASRPYPLGAAALALTVITVAIVAWNGYQTAQVNRLAAQNTHLASAMKGQWDALAMATDPSVQTVSFRGTDASPQTRGSLLLHHEHQKAVLLVVDLKPPGRGEVYQFWLWEPGTGELQPVGTFQTLPDGYGVWTFRPPQAASQDMRFGVTREPAGGSGIPTGPMLFSGNLPGQAAKASFLAVAD